MVSTRYLGHAALGCGVVLVVASLVAGGKLLPFALKSGVALGSIGPLAAAAFATVLEVSCLLGTAPGFAVATQRRSMSREPSSAVGSALGSSLRAAFGSALVWAVVTITLGGLANFRLATPGRVANGLLETAREACEVSPETKQVTIPILGSRWQCNSQGSPTLVGEFYHASSGVTYSASEMSVSDDMTYVELSKLKLESKATKTRPGLRLAVDGARLRGFWPLARPARLGAVGRATLVSSTALLLAVLAVWALGYRRLSPWLSAGLGLSFSLSAWLTLLYLDRGTNHAPLHYALVPLVGCALTLAGGVLLRSKWVEQQFMSVFRRFGRKEA